MRIAVLRWIGPLLLASVTLCGQQYKADKAGPPPPEVAAGIAQALGKNGFQISSKDAAYCEIWLRATLPPSASSKEQNVTLPNIPQGTLLGVIRFEGKGSDRRGRLSKRACTHCATGSCQ